MGETYALAEQTIFYSGSYSPAWACSPYLSLREATNILPVDYSTCINSENETRKALASLLRLFSERLTVPLSILW